MKNRIFKNLVLSIATLLISASIAITTFAAGSCKIQFQDPTTTRGKTFSVVMKIKADDVRLQKADVTVAYDQNALEFKQGTNAEGGAGTIRINGSGKTTSHKILEYELKFTALSAGTHTINVVTNEVYDVNDQTVSVTKVGSSKVKVKPSSTSSNNSKLKSLQVSPGVLSPEFSSDVMEYTVEVPSDVTSLTINALAEDGDATTVINGNQDFKTGPNQVQINVTAADNVTKRAYTINVNKLETGVSSQTTASSDGDKLTSKEVTVTVMSMPEGTEAPYGMEKTSISNAGVNDFEGFIPKGDSDQNYYVFYGMNAAGETGFYRYDIKENTIQRYFVDPASSELQIKLVENANLVQQNAKLQSNYKKILIVLVICVILLLVMIILFILKKGRGPKKKDHFDDDDITFETYKGNKRNSYDDDKKESYAFMNKKKDEKDDDDYSVDNTPADVIDLD